MREVLVNVAFKDVCTGEVYAPGKTYPMSEARVNEVKKVNPHFITVVRSLPDEVPGEALEVEIPDEAPEETPKGKKKK